MLNCPCFRLRRRSTSDPWTPTTWRRWSRSRSRAPLPVHLPTLSLVLRTRILDVRLKMIVCVRFQMTPCFGMQWNNNPSLTDTIYRIQGMVLILDGTMIQWRKRLQIRVDLTRIRTSRKTKPGPDPAVKKNLFWPSKFQSFNTRVQK